MQAVRTVPDSDDDVGVAGALTEEALLPVAGEARRRALLAQDELPGRRRTSRATAPGRAAAESSMGSAAPQSAGAGGAQGLSESGSDGVGSGYHWFPHSAGDGSGFFPDLPVPTMGPKVVERHAITLPDGSVYEGGMWDGEFEGPGVLRAAGDAFVYDGSFRRGRYHGVGVLRLGSGEAYFGDWWDNKPHGRGLWRLLADGDASIRYSRPTAPAGGFDGVGLPAGRTLEDFDPAWGVDGSGLSAALRRSQIASVADARPLRHKSSSDGGATDVYRGTVQDGLPSGNGKMQYASGDEYDGAWEAGRWSGHGLLRRASGGWRSGEWRNGLPVGCGTAVDATGTRFVGTWDDTSAWTGEGELTRHDGATYMGTWLASERHGYGHARHTDGTSYKGTYWHNRRHGRGVIRDADDNIVWDGDLDDGVRHGRGVLTEITTIELTELAEPTVVTITWDGTWAGGRFHGLGTWERSDGVFYRGEWRNGQRAGRGDSRDEDGSVYDGEWRNDVRHGQGEATFADGAKYVGQWADGAFHGAGKHESADGTVYEGNFKAGERHGRGSCRLSNGDRYEGEYVNGKRHGRGELWMADGSTYAGSFERGVRSGYGVLNHPTSPTTVKYDGQWKADKPHGNGSEVRASGDRYDGHFVRGHRHGVGRLESEAGDVYEGEFRAGRFDGYGLMMFGNGDVHRGRYHAGRETGLGTFTSWRTGTWYSGEWAQGRRHGKGAEWFPECGCVYFGFYADGNPSGRGEYHFSFTDDVVVQSLNTDDGGDIGVDDDAQDADQEAAQQLARMRARGRPTGDGKANDGDATSLAAVVEVDDDDDVPTSPSSTAKLVRQRSSGRRFRPGRQLFTLRSASSSAASRCGVALLTILMGVDVVADWVAGLQFARLGGEIVGDYSGVDDDLRAQRHNENAAHATLGNTGLTSAAWLSFWWILLGALCGGLIAALLAHSVVAGAWYTSPLGWLRESWRRAVAGTVPLSRFNVHTQARALSAGDVAEGNPVQGPYVAALNLSYDDGDGPIAYALRRHRYPVFARGEALALFRTTAAAAIGAAPVSVLRAWALLELVETQRNNRDVFGAEGALDIGVAGFVLAALVVGVIVVAAAATRLDERGLAYHKTLRSFLPERTTATPMDRLPERPRVPGTLLALMALTRGVEVPARSCLLALLGFRFGGWAIGAAVASTFVAAAAFAAASALFLAATGLTVRLGGRDSGSGAAAWVARDAMDGGCALAARRLSVLCDARRRALHEHCGGGAAFVVRTALLQLLAAAMAVFALPPALHVPPLHLGFPGSPNAFMVARALEELAALAVLWAPVEAAAADAERARQLRTGAIGVVLGVVTLALCARMLLTLRVRVAAGHWMRQIPKPAPTQEQAARAALGSLAKGGASKSTGESKELPVPGGDGADRSAEPSLTALLAPALGISKRGASGGASERKVSPLPSRPSFRHDRARARSRTPAALPQTPGEGWASNEWGQ